MKLPLSNFQDSYNQLNNQQKEAVDTIEGPVMVIAGPGTGKTQILTLRIANILLKTQVNPSNILALTFTQAAATNMRERLGTIIGPEAHSVNIFTFHAFCSHIIEQNPDDFWSILGMKLADDVKKAQLLEKIFDDNPFELIKPFGKKYFYLPKALKAISDLKREGVSPKELKIFVAEDMKNFDSIPNKESTRIIGSLKGIYQDQLRSIKRNEELCIAYERYQQSLHEHNIYDYDDLIMSVLQKLNSDEDFRLRQMEQYQYILVDEHQDSNNAQNKIIQLLTTFHNNPNIFVVGDEKQAIFRFQGASIENIRRFSKLYKDAKIVTLSHNYRSTQTILDSAIGFLSADNQKLQAHLRHDEKPISVVIAQDPNQELSELTKRIANDVESGIKPDEIAVLTRTRVQMQSVAQALATAKLPVFMDYDQDIFDSAIVQKLLILLQAIRYYAQDEYLFPALHIDFLKFYPLDLYKLNQLVSRGRKNLADVLADPQKLADYEISHKENIHKFFNKLGEWYILCQNTPLYSLLHTVVQESGLLDHALNQPNPIVAVAPLRELYDIVQSLDQENTWKLQDLFTYLEKVKEHNIHVKIKIKTQNEGKIQVMTVHSSKGLEFDHVYIPFIQDNVWGKSAKKNLFKLPNAVYNLSDDGMGDDEEKRLFFVALTRARKQVILSYSKTAIDGVHILPSPYIEEIKQELKHNEFPEPYTVTQIQIATRQVPIIGEFKTFVQASFAKYGLSVSALNNYLQCPWKYFYVNLVRVPSGKDKILMFGNAVHNAITYFYKHYKDTGEKSYEYLLRAFDMSAEHELFTKVEIGDALVRGKQILMEYYKRYEDVFSRNVQVKYRIPEVVKGIEPVEKIESIKLTGELDLVQFIDNSLTNVSVVDFKTGRVRSRGEITGTTKEADGNYFRQLVFYKLLLHHYKPSWKMREAILDFVQPDNKGNFHRESFEITDDDMSKLEVQINNCAKDILTLGFWDRYCDQPDCQWCKLRRNLEPRFVEDGLF